jgi:hypothetical protein
MMHAHSLSIRPLAVPGIGFVQSAPAGGNVIDFAAFRRGAVEACFGKGRDERAEAAVAEPPGIIDLMAAGFIVLSIAFGPMLAWLLVGVAAG